MKDKEEIYEKYLLIADEDTLTIDHLFRKFMNLDESKKSLFVGKLIGIGVLKKDKNGKLIKNKDWSKEKIQKQLKKKITTRKVIHKIRKVIKGKK